MTTIPPLIDSHAHLTYPDFAGRIDEVLANRDAAGVEQVITIGTTLPDAKSAIDLAQKYPTRIRPAVGFHLHHADAVSDDAPQRMAGPWDSPSIVGFGEMGLDHHYNHAPPFPFVTPSLRGSPQVSAFGASEFRRLVPHPLSPSLPVSPFLSFSLSLPPLSCSPPFPPSLFTAPRLAL